MPKLLPVCVFVSLLQHLDDLGQQVSWISGAQQVQQHLLTVFITDDLIQRRQDLLNRWETGDEIISSRVCLNSDHRFPKNQTGVS